eukprot:scaffold140448_cov26-Prasinocladus_malaysianus.AAC.1
MNPWGVSDSSRSAPSPDVYHDSVSEHRQPTSKSTMHPRATRKSERARRSIENVLTARRRKALRMTGFDVLKAIFAASGNLSLRGSAQHSRLGFS